MPARESISAAQARRIVLGAQGLAAPRPDRAVDGWALRALFDRVGLVQIDSVNVLVRAHYLPLFSRFGPYPPGLLDAASGTAPRRLFEYWGHEASLIPVATEPLLRWRMARAEQDAWGGMQRIALEQPDLLDRVLAGVAERGPITARELSEEHGERHRTGPWWDWSAVKHALEFLFWSGEVASARRRRFERLYDLRERVLPAAVRAVPTPAVDEAQRGLLRVAARGLGVMTERDLRDYFRLPTAEAKARIAELVEAGDLAPVNVEGWRETAYLDPSARIPRQAGARALIGPFDSLLWERSRLERVFGLRHRLEIYVPAAKRTHGYYVLPFLFGDRFAARVDLKSDRATGRLLVQALHIEDGAPPEARDALDAELELMAGWLGAERVVHAGRRSGSRRDLGR